MGRVTGAELISRSLADWGVDTAFAIAGDHTLAHTLEDEGYGWLDD